MTARKVIAYSYRRFSSAEQAHGNSEARQSESTTAFAVKHGWTIDTSLKMFDKGKSAFKRSSQTCLKGFLAAVEDGKVRPGSVLIVEQLDRLSRDEILEAFDLFSRIIRAGVSVATIHPERIYTQKNINEGFGLIEPLIQFSLAHEESKKKSFRSTDNWKRQRQAARESGKPGGVFPAWIVRSGDGFALDPAKEKAVQLIFQLTIDNGWGAKRIVNELNARKIPNIALGLMKSAKRTWNHQAVRNILRNRSTFGEHQPCLKVEKKQVPDGEPIANYFPAVIDEKTFYAAQASAEGRRRRKLGRSAKNSPNLFTGLLYDARTATPMRMQTAIPKPPEPKSVRLTSNHRGVGMSWKYENFEEGFLAFLSEVSFDDIKPSRSAASDTESLGGQLLEVTANIAKIQAQVLAGADFDTLRELLVKLSIRKAELESALEAARASSARSLTTTGEITDLAAVLAKTPEADQDDIRARIKAKLRLAVDSVWMLIEEYAGPIYKTRVATVQVFVREQSRVFVLVRKMQKWYYFPLNPKGRNKFDLRQWSGKPLYPMHEGGIRFPWAGLE